MTLSPDEAVKKMYSDPEYIKGFLGIKLWPSEKVLIGRYFKAGTSVLDIGCGAGRVAIALSFNGYIATGIDILPAMLEAGEKQIKEHNAKVRLLKMDAANMIGFPDNSFDNAVMAYNAYELNHGRRKRLKVISEVARILKPGGHFIITIRSGFAFGKRMMWWLLFPLHYLYFKLKFHGRCEWAPGDALRGISFHHYYNPFKLRSTVKNFGFELIDFNSSCNIERNKPASFFTNFSPDRALFYVFRKN